MPRISTSTNEDQLVCYRAGSRVNLSSGAPIAFGRPRCGERGDSFLVRVLFTQGHKQTKIQAVGCSGYWEMHRALWEVINTSKCAHPHHSMDADFPLPIGVCAIALQWDKDFIEPMHESRVLVLLTANKIAARWRSLVAIDHHRHGLLTDFNPSRTMLRSKDCCSQCAIQQALLQPDRCYLVL